jgi:hypothetical protein
MIHFIYKTTHKNGKYYVGRHSTTNIDDGYIGSGNWPRSLKNKNDVVREIVEYADNIDDLIVLEGRYLRKHFGQPGCMNATLDPVGWSSENNPMKDPDVVDKFRGDNHWTNKHPEKVVRGDEHWLRKDTEARDKFLENHPNKDGRNAKLAMERGTHINLGENNPAKQWSRDGTHPWQTNDDGTSTGALTNAKRVEEGTHNFLGPEANQKRIDDGSHNFLGSSANEKMLAAGTHPSQIKMTCEHCGKTASKGMFTRWHGDKCRDKK